MRVLVVLMLLASSLLAAGQRDTPRPMQPPANHRRAQARVLVENIGWLTASKRRAMLYDNAARFLRLDAHTIARHHGR